jgi:pimeloyl-ACP methyl ester carboxylesterase
MARMRPLLYVALGLVIAVSALWIFQRRLIYLPDLATPPLPPGYAAVTLTTDDGLALGAWLVTPDRAGDRDIAVLVAPGNAGNRGGRAPLADALAAAGFTVLLMDYRGYGGNPGRPTEDGLRRDAVAAQTYLAARSTRIVYLGESLGAAVVTGLATTHPPDGLVLRSPFSSLAAVGAHLYPYLPARLLLRDEFPVADQVASLDVPITVVYGDADRVVPPAQSRAVAEAAGARTVVVPGADHDDAALTDGPKLVDAVVAMTVNWDA